MRNAVQPYRQLFPAALADVVIGDAGVPLYGWVELTPSAAGAYEVQPGARSGTTDLNWAREVEDHVVEVGALVWMRHRDQDGAVHFEFVRPPLPSVGPPPPPPSSAARHCPECCYSGQCLEEDLCLEVDSITGDTKSIAGLYALTFHAALGEWRSTAQTKAGLIVARLGCFPPRDAGHPDGVLKLGIRLPGGDFELAVPDCALPWDSGALLLSDGTVRLKIREGKCDDCDSTIGGNVCVDGTLTFRNTFPVDVVTGVCPVFTEIDLAALGGSGSVGPQGEKGDVGATGATGSAGAKGDTGDPGPAGHSITVTVSSSSPAGPSLGDVWIVP